MEINKCTTRVGWIDFCKGIGIFLVVLGHILRDVIAVDYIYSFHMPLFFFLSGLVFNAGKYDWKTLLKSRFNSLLLPYVFFYLLTLVYYIIVESHFRQIEVSALQSIAGMFVAAQIDGLMEHNGILWFLPCLFVVELLCFAVSRINDIKKEILAVISLAAIGFLVRTPLPWCLNIAMVCLQFFFIGRVYKLLSSRVVAQLCVGGINGLQHFAWLYYLV